MNNVNVKKPGASRKGNLEIKLTAMIPNRFTGAEYQETLQKVMFEIFNGISFEGVSSDRELDGSEFYSPEYGQEYMNYSFFLSYSGDQSREEVFKEIIRFLRENTKKAKQKFAKKEALASEIISEIKIKMH